MNKISPRKNSLKYSGKPKPVKALGTKKRFSQRSSSIVDILHTENSTLPARRPRLSSQFKPKSLNRSLNNGKIQQDIIDKLTLELKFRDEEIDKLKTNLHQKIEKFNSIILEMYEKVAPSPLKIFEIANRNTLQSIQKDEDVHLKDLILSLEMTGHKVPVSDIQDFLKIFPSVLPVEVFIALTNKYHQVDIPVEVRDAIKHLEMRLQTNNISKEELDVKLFGRLYDPFSPIKKEYLRQKLSQPPFSIHGIDEQEALCKFLIGPNTIADNVIRKLMTATQDWTIQTPSQLEALDKYFSSLIANYDYLLKYECEKYDPSSSGTIPLTLFIKILKEFEPNIDESLENHIGILAYSFTYKLNAAPYVQFLKQFAVKNDGESEADRVNLIKKYLALISRHLAERNLSVNSAFKNTEGYIMPKDFARGLTFIGLGEIEHDLKVMMVEALQTDDFEDRICISSKEFEEILSYYSAEANELQTVESSASVVIKQEFIKENNTN